MCPCQCAFDLICDSAGGQPAVMDSVFVVSSIKDPQSNVFNLVVNTNSVLKA